MDSLVFARLAHVLGVVLWIGGVGFVTLALLPTLRSSEAAAGLAVFQATERRFANLARAMTLIVGASGLYMVNALGAWDRFVLPGYWWMQAMTGVWALFTLILFVIEPFVLPRLPKRRPSEPGTALRRLQRMHWLLLALSLIATAGAVVGVHG